MSQNVYHSQGFTRMASLVLLLGLAVGVANADITSGLVGYYPLDEGAGDIANDMSGEGHNGTLHNGMTWIAEAYQGGGVNCDGTADTRIELGTWNPAAGTGQLSLALWIRWAGGGGTYQGLIGKRDLWADTTMFQFQVRPESGGTFRLETGTHAIVSPANTLDPLVQTWVHVAATFDGTTARLYLNGEEVASGAFAFYAAGEGSNMGIGCVTGGGAGFSGNTEVFLGDMDEVCIYNRALSAEEVPLVMAGIGEDTASDPRPEDEATDVPRDVVLAWGPVETAATRDVYFGKVYDDVNDASWADARDVLVSPGQTATTYDPDGLLEYGQTYYWRVDEVNAPPDGTVFTGQVWSFTAEPFAYSVESLTVEASSQQPASPATSTIDGSGLNADDQHSDDLNHMWMSIALPAWIEYSFDKEYILDELWVWNANSQLESYMSFGAKDVTIQYSTDGEVWTELEDVPEFAKGTGLTTYVANTIVDFGGVTAKYVRLTINGTWGNPMATSLSEVRFLYVPMQAREPQPASGASGVALDAVLNWRPGRGAVEHEVYLSTDLAAVEDGSALLGTIAEHRYDLSLEALEYGQTVYWKINELDGSGTVLAEGDIWSFSTTEYFLVDDFESYTNDSPNRVFQTWVDGLGFSADDHFSNDVAGNGTGALVGHDIWTVGSEHYEGSIVESFDVHGGGQAMPLYYDNASSPFYSEAIRTWTAAQDWTIKGVTDVSLWFRGYPAGMVQTGADSFTMSASGTDIWGTADEFRFAYKQLNGNGSIIARVDSLIDTNGWAKAGVMIRESLSPGAAHAMTVLTPGYGVSFARRIYGNEATAQHSELDLVAPYWVKITRTGNTLKAEHSADGSTWTSVGPNVGASSVEISMVNTVYIGLCLTSHNADAVTVAAFSEVETSGGVSGQWQVEEVGIDHPENDVADLYIGIEDASGRMATVSYSEGATVNGWTQWKVPLADFAGVDVSAVRKMYLGAGDRGAPALGGTGVVLFDDVHVMKPASGE